MGCSGVRPFERLYQRRYTSTTDTSPYGHNGRGPHGEVILLHGSGKKALHFAAQPI
ncbi:uncharacterized protein PHALS_09064 [Plasmopara halstedii]|uniref:Uncharacterized protein n=1 Tax=Plasmopara halstedii TaxID=4781 RepID=A0A0P1ADV3_PLAHL|nr:uncharacterized protein PHALS_09064 [Plasmopara halstedii]CEG38999.1 hypothetical protein PHALS_09064 [Plasmopara halstedii]|eukprot:XP_024575368.1 hypothetical protein PHALS_09064 [Plasmopara halstedii]